MVVGPLLVAALLLMVLRRGRRSYPRVDISLPPALPVAASVHSELAVKGLPAPGAAEAERAKMHQELSDVARSDPAAVAQLVRTWIQEDPRS